MNNILFGTWVRQQREKKDLSRVELGTLLGISDQWVAKIEQNSKNPGPKLRARIEKFFEEPNGDHKVGDLIMIQGLTFRVQSLTMAIGHPPQVKLVHILEEAEIARAKDETYAKLYESGQFWRIDTPYNENDGGELEYSVSDAIAFLLHEKGAGKIGENWAGVTVWAPDGKKFDNLAVQRFIDFEGRV